MILKKSLESVLLIVLLPPLQLCHQLRVLQGRLARLAASVSAGADGAASVGLLLPVTHAHVRRGLHVVTLLPRRAVSLAHSLLIHAYHSRPVHLSLESSHELSLIPSSSAGATPLLSRTKLASSTGLLLLLLVSSTRVHLPSWSRA